LIFYKQWSLLPIAGEELAPRPFRAASLAVILNTQDLEMPKMADSEKDVILEMYHTGNYEEFSCWKIVFYVVMKMKIVGKQLLNKLQRNTRRHQKIRKPMMMTA
jgi:hypothetical protein